MFLDGDYMLKSIINSHWMLNILKTFISKYLNFRHRPKGIQICVDKAAHPFWDGPQKKLYICHSRVTSCGQILRRGLKYCRRRAQNICWAAPIFWLDLTKFLVESHKIFGWVSQNLSFSLFANQLWSVVHFSEKCCPLFRKMLFTFQKISVGRFKNSVHFWPISGHNWTMPVSTCPQFVTLGVTKMEGIVIATDKTVWRRHLQGARITRHP